MHMMTSWVVDLGKEPLILALLCLAKLLRLVMDNMLLVQVIQL